MILVLDTNVFVAACFGGHATRIVQAWLAGKYGLVVSDPVLDEYAYVLGRHPIAQRRADWVSHWRVGLIDRRSNAAHLGACW